ncbi:MAG: RimK family alpha-L-glutamate ligase [Candidatus Nanohaloarchaea archaeon]
MFPDEMGELLDFLLNTQRLPEAEAEADLLVGADSLGSLEPTIGELEERGYDVLQVPESDISVEEDGVYIGDREAAEFAGTDFLLRNKRGYRNADYLPELRQSGIDFLNEPEGAEVCDDKLATKQVLEQFGISTTDTYWSQEELDMALASGQKVAAKLSEGSHGAGFEVLEPGAREDFEPDRVYEELVDHWNDPHVEERRAVVFAGSSENRIIESQTRQSVGEYEPKNVANGGSYQDPDIYFEDEFETLWDTADVLGGGLLGIDYTVDTRTGEAKIIEANSTVQLGGIRNAASSNGYDLDEELADALETEIGGTEEYIGRVAAGHLEERAVYREKEGGPDDLPETQSPETPRPEGYRPQVTEAEG